MVDKSVLKELLAQHPIFKTLDADTTDALADHAREKTFKRGVLIFRQDADASHFYLIKGGEVSVEIPAIYGAPITMQTLHAGAILGWSWIFPPYKWHFDARATEACTLIEFDGTALRARCEEDPKIGYALVKHFAAFMMDRLNASRRKVMETYNPDG
jgi:CRP-like cAMP-binding protein